MVDEISIPPNIHGEDKPPDPFPAAVVKIAMFQDITVSRSKHPI